LSNVAIPHRLTEGVLTMFQKAKDDVFFAGSKNHEIATENALNSFNDLRHTGRLNANLR
jgi:hypothetical protein